MVIKTNVYSARKLSLPCAAQTVWVPTPVPDLETLICTGNIGFRVAQGENPFDWVSVQGHQTLQLARFTQHPFLPLGAFPISGAQSLGLLISWGYLCLCPLKLLMGYRKVLLLLPMAQPDLTPERACLIYPNTSFWVSLSASGCPTSEDQTDSGKSPRGKLPARSHQRTGTL